MRLKLYNLFVNKQAGIKSRYHRMHDNATGARKVISWFYLLWLNFAYYVLFCRFLGKEPAVKVYEERNLLQDTPESSTSPDLKAFMKKLSQYDIVSFDIFDTLIFRPFSEPTDLFYFVGEKLGYMDFKRVRMEAEGETRWEKYKKEASFEVTLEDIWKRIEEKTGLSAEKGIQIEQEMELKFCYANPFMQQIFYRMQELGKSIIIVSDMYLSEAFLRKILEKNGYTGFEKIYVSCEYDKNKASGELFEFVKEELLLNDNEIIHVGDNENSDVKKARKAGFSTCYYPNVNKNCLLYRSYDMSPIIGGAYRGLVNTHLNCGLYKHSMEYEYGYIYGGLFVLGYCSFIYDYCKKNNVDKLLFLSRDGDILSQAYEKMYPGENIEYVYWSRKAATKLMASSDRYDYFRRFIDHKVNQNFTLQQIFDSMELKTLDEKCWKVFAPEDKLTSDNVKKVKKLLLENWDDVLACYEEEHNAAKTYYEDVLRGCQKVVAIDIGWAGSGAIALNHLINQVWDISCEVVGILAGTNTVHNAEADASVTFLQSGQLVSYLYSSSHNRDLMKKHDLNKDYNVFWELLLSSPKPQFTGFDWADEMKETVKFRFGKMDANQEGIVQVQEGVLQFIDEYLEHFKDIPYMTNVSGRDAYAPMLVAASNKEKYLKKMRDRFHLVIGVE